MKMVKCLCGGLLLIEITLLFQIINHTCTPWVRAERSRYQKPCLLLTTDCVCTSDGISDQTSMLQLNMSSTCDTIKLVS